MSKSRLALAVLAVTLTACADDPMAPDTELTRQSAVLSSDSRAIWSFADTYQSGVDGSGNPIFSPAGIRSDGRGAYEGGLCGVETRIFWYDLGGSRSGDATFDPDGMRATGCSARKLHFYLNGVKTIVGPGSNAREVMQLAVGESRVQQMGFGVALNKSCERIAFRLEDGSGVRVTRTDTNTDPQSPRSWAVESTGNHVGACLKLSKGALVPSGISYVLPFSATITEVQ